MKSHIKGCVDGITDNELRGWIANIDCPDRFERVICQAPDGQSLDFRPFVYREDVTHNIHRDGVFGFAIPLELLVSLGDVCRVTDCHGVELQNGSEVRLPPRNLSNISGALTHIFLHVPKTAGTSLRNTLLQSVPKSQKLLIYPGVVPGISAARFHLVPLRQRTRLTWLFGHIKFGIDRHISQASRYITFVRDPIERLRSNFNHHIALGSRFQIDSMDLHPATVLNEGLSEDYDNAMTRALAGIGREMVPLGQMGDDEVAIALNNVRRHFCFVGKQSEASSDTLTLQRYLGLPLITLAVDNVSSSMDKYELVDAIAIDWKRIAGRNSPDILLYSRLEQEGLVSRILCE